MPLDFADLKDVEMIVDTLLNFVQRRVPVRFGIVPTLSSSESRLQAKIVYYLLDRYGLGAIIAYLEVVSSLVFFDREQKLTYHSRSREERFRA